MFVYMLLCRDGTLYTGTARNLERRMRDHFERTRAAAAYTRARGARSLLCAWECDTLSAALRAEYAIKQLSRAEKERLLASPSQLCEEHFASLSGCIFTPLSPSSPLLLSIREKYESPKDG